VFIRMIRGSRLREVDNQQPAARRPVGDSEDAPAHGCAFLLPSLLRLLGLLFSLADVPELPEKFIALGAGLAGAPGLFGEVALARDRGVLQGVGPSAQLPRGPFRQRFQI
jgi:hypothetical protein